MKKTESVLRPKVVSTSEKEQRGPAVNVLATLIKFLLWKNGNKHKGRENCIINTREYITQLQLRQLVANLAFSGFLPTSTPPNYSEKLLRHHIISIPRYFSVYL